jgi:hypothetical protein
VIVFIAGQLDGFDATTANIESDDTLALLQHERSLLMSGMPTQVPYRPA